MSLPSIVSSPSSPDNRPSTTADPRILPFPGVRPRDENELPPHTEDTKSPSGARGAPPGSPAAESRDDPRRLEATRQEIQRLYRDAAQRVDSLLTPTAFAEGHLDRLIQALGSLAGRLWLASSEEHWELVGQAAAGPDPETILASLPPGPPRHLEALLQGTERAIAVSPEASTDAPAKTAHASPSSARNPHGEFGVVRFDVSPPGDEPFLSLLTRFSVVEGQVGVIEILHRPGASESAQRGYLRFAIQMADLAADFFRRHQLRQYRQQEVLWGELRLFLAQLHHKLDQQHVAYTVANEGRRLIGCDRVSIVQTVGRGCRVLAMSGTDTFNSRAENVRALRSLTQAVMRTRQPIWYPNGHGDLPPQITQALHDYLDPAQARAVAVLPLLPPRLPGDIDSNEPDTARSPLGALVCEQLRTARFEPAQQARAESIAGHAGLALANAREHQGLLLLPVWKGISKLLQPLTPRHLPKTILACTLVASLVAGLLLIPADFRVHAPGKLLPTSRRDVFAHVPGIIAQVHARHADRVAQGQLLLTMRSTEIAVGLSELEGQRARTVEQIFAKEQLLLRNSRLSPVVQDQIAGELDELKQALESIEHRIELFRERESRLYVRSPMSGEVVTWQVEDALEQRPVSTGQVLMSIIDPDGTWELELYVPERRLGHVLQARESTPDPLRVEFQLSTHPGQAFTGDVVEIQRMAEHRGEQGNSVALRVAIRKDELPQLHNESSVSAHVDCGRRPLGFVLFQDVIETLHSTLVYWK
jgi:hypothetical protein